ncbi:hypothetical protein QQF64_016556 [Cirrhinus molitorella]|uniref:Uncharacterized protein n=1 Tax=Cirrhinus molitorella TaxID=172907 RepID=A0ABR3LN56_9TELE
MGKRKAKHHPEASMEKNENSAKSQLFAPYPDDAMLTDLTNDQADIAEAEKSLAIPLPCTPAKSPAPKKGKITSSDCDLNKVMAAIQSLSAKCEIIFEKVTSMESTVRNTDQAIAFLNESVEKLIKETVIHNERISALSKTLDLRDENKQLKLQLLEANSYRRRWGLRLHGVKEEDQQENTRDLVIKVLGKVSPKIAEKLPEVVDSVHRIGKRKEGNAARGIIIQFSMRHFRDIVWRDARGSKFLEDAHLRLKEDLSPDERVVKKAREEGKRASFVGAFAYIEGKKVNIDV